MHATTGRAAKIATAAAVVPATLLFAVTTVAAAAPAGATARDSHHAAGHARAPRLRVRQIVKGMRLRHTFVPAGTSTHKSEPLTNPDDTTMMGPDLFTAFQNGVGSQGEPSSDGNTASTVVEYTPGGRVVRQWDIVGKCDGLTADPARGLVIATVNEDAHSSVYTITPGRGSASAQIRHYHYNRPLPHKGGTDAISIYHGRVLISASAPGTTGKPAPQPTYPAVYSVTFHHATRIASVTPVFSDEAHATVANRGASAGKVVRLGLTDPDSNEVVPHSARRFAGDFMLTSQADKEQIFTGRGGLGRRLSVLRLSQSVDDTAWVGRFGGALYASDDTSDTVDVVTGRFPAGAVLVAVTPCDAANAPATCPGPGFPPNYLGSLNPFTGHITRVPLSGASFEPKGMVFVGSTGP
jgi:hypothetical protein